MEDNPPKQDSPSVDEVSGFHQRKLKGIGMTATGTAKVQTIGTDYAVTPLETHSCQPSTANPRQPMLPTKDTKKATVKDTQLSSQNVSPTDVIFEDPDFQESKLSNGPVSDDDACSLDTTTMAAALTSEERTTVGFGPRKSVGDAAGYPPNDGGRHPTPPIQLSCDDSSASHMNRKAEMGIHFDEEDNNNQEQAASERNPGRNRSEISFDEFPTRQQQPLWEQGNHRQTEVTPEVHLSSSTTEGFRQRPVGELEGLSGVNQEAQLLVGGAQRQRRESTSATDGSVVLQSVGVDPTAVLPSAIPAVVPQQQTFVVAGRDMLAQQQSSVVFIAENISQPHIGAAATMGGQPQQIFVLPPSAQVVTLNSGIFLPAGGIYATANPSMLSLHTGAPTALGVIAGGLAVGAPAAPSPPDGQESAMTHSDSVRAGAARDLHNATCADEKSAVSQSKTPQEQRQQSIMKFRSGDVLFGRSKLARRHPGNIKFRKVIRMRCREYQETKVRARKNALIVGIITTVTDKDGGRFLKCDNETDEGDGDWYEVDEAATYDKVSHDLRSCRARRKKEQDDGDE